MSNSRRVQEILPLPLSPQPSPAAPDSVAALDQLGERAHALLPQLERLLCFVREEGSGPVYRLLFDSQDPAPDPQPWPDPVHQWHRSTGRDLFAQALPPHLIVGVPCAGQAFGPGEQSVLALLADLAITHLSARLEVLQALQLAVDVAHDFVSLRDSETGHHLERVSRITRLIASELALSHRLTPVFIDQLSRFARLHDIGKIGIPDQILGKPGPLTAEERRVMDTHVELGLAILQRLLHQHRILEQPATRLMAEVIGTHHERLDGSGYPAGLRGEAIPLAGRIVAVADVFDSVTSRRPYRRATSVQEGLNLVQRLAGEGKLDPDCVQALEMHRPALERLVADYRDP